MGFTQVGELSAQQVPGSEQGGRSRGVKAQQGIYITTLCMLSQHNDNSTVLSEGQHSLSPLPSPLLLVQGGLQLLCLGVQPPGVLQQTPRGPFLSLLPLRHLLHQGHSEGMRSDNNPGNRDKSQHQRDCYHHKTQHYKTKTARQHDSKVARQQAIKPEVLPAVRSGQIPSKPHLCLSLPFSLRTSHFLPHPLQLVHQSPAMLRRGGTDRGRGRGSGRPTLALALTLLILEGR